MQANYFMFFNSRFEEIFMQIYFTSRDHRPMLKGHSTSKRLKDALKFPSFASLAPPRQIRVIGYKIKLSSCAACAAA